MKQIILYTNNNLTDNLPKDIGEPYYRVKIAKSHEHLENIKNADYYLIDTDLFEDYQNIIDKYKKNKEKFWAITSDTSKNNILKLYTSGFDNVIPRPLSLISTLDTMANPENDDIEKDDALNYQSLKKVLIIDDNRLNIELLIQVLDEFDYLYTIRTNTFEAIEEIQKDNYDLIIIDSTTPTKSIFEAAECINKSLTNQNTPFIFISSSPETKNIIKSYELGSYSYIEKPYNIEILKAQIRNVLKVKELQDNLFRENKLLENMIKYSTKQPIITNSNFIVLTAGIQYLPIGRGDYFFNYLKENNINYPEEKIIDFSNNDSKNINFVFEFLGKFFDTQITKIYSKNGNLEHYLIMVDDITNARIIEEQKETFIATLTHDLKSPIRAEQSILSQMLEGKFGELNVLQKEILSEMLNSREYMKRMIDNILTRYKFSSDKFEIVPEENSYKATIDESIKEVMYLITTKNQQIRVSYNACSDYILYDKTEIKRVLVNLIANASEYTPPKGKIFVCVEETENKIITKIIDTGYGIAEKDITRIFDKNVTLAKKYRKVGSGLGLYISKSIIEAHKGKLLVQSKLNEGSTFIFILPKITQQNSNLTEQTNKLLLS